MRLHEAIVVALAAGGVLASIPVQTARAGTDDAARGEAEWLVMRDTRTLEQIRRFIWEAPYGSPHRRDATKWSNALEPTNAAPWPLAPIQGVWVPPKPPPWAFAQPSDPPSNVLSNPPSEPWDWNAPRPAHSYPLRRGPRQPQRPSALTPAKIT